MSKERPDVLHLSDPRFRITPYQQMGSACSGVLLTSVISKYLILFASDFLKLKVCLMSIATLSCILIRKHLFCQ